MAKRRSKPRSRTPPDDGGNVRERILAVFSARARYSGIRAVRMGEIASELRMSAMTLYKHFASKDDLVAGMVDAWALDIAAIDALEWEKARTCQSALEVLLAWADAWTASLSHVSPAFFQDLHRDHPAAWARFHAVIAERQQIAAGYLAPFLRDDVHPAAAFLMLDGLARQAADPRFGEQAGLSRRDAVRAAISLWGSGALRERTSLPRVEATLAPRSSFTAPAIFPPATDPRSGT